MSARASAKSRPEIGWTIAGEITTSLRDPFCTTPAMASKNCVERWMV
jgi:hypothetical protein